MSKLNDSQSETYGKKAIEYVSHLCEYGPRITSTPEEKVAAEDIISTLKNFCDETKLDEFSLYPDLYPGGFIKITAFSVILGFFCLFLDGFWSIFAIILPILGFIQLYYTYLRMSEFFGFLFKKKKSYNATGRIFPRDETGKIIEAKKRVVICGHIDSAYQMKLTRLGDKLVYALIPGFGHIILQILFGLIKPFFITLGNPTIIVNNFGFIITELDIIFLIICIITLPGFFFLFWGLVGGKPVHGANDNLSGVGIALALAEYFSKEENRLKNVELWLGGFGSEECGERGAKAFIDKYKPEGLLDNAYNIIPESCGAGDRLAIITKEPTHFATHDIELCNDFFKGYQTFIEKESVENPIPCKVEKLPFSASDAGRFSLVGLKATMFIAFDGKLAKPTNWHNEKDIAENLDLDIMKTVFGTYKHYIKNLDEKL